MADGKWQALKFDLGPVPGMADAIQKMVAAIEAALTMVKTATEVAATFIVDNLTVEALLIRTALQAIEDVLKQFTQSGAALHILTVPPRKFLPFIDESATDWTTYDNPYINAGAPPSAADARDFYNQLDAVFKVLGGNPAYGKTVLESLDDQNDVNRPQYDATCAYYSVVIVAGATSIIELIGYIERLAKVLKGTVRNPLVPTMIARPPQDVRVSTIAAPNSGRMAVRVSWTNPPTDQEIRVFDDAKPLFTRIEEVAIVRSTDPRTVAAQSWDELTINYQPTKLGANERTRKNDKTFTTAKGQTDVLRIFKFDGIRESYVDDDPALQKGLDYYYAVAYRYSLGLPDTNGKLPDSNRIPQRYAQISNVAKATVDKNYLPARRTGAFPDWDATPSALDIIPDLKYFLTLLTNYVETLKSQISGANSALMSYVQFLQREIDRYAAYADAVAQRIAALTELAKIGQGGLYVTIIEGAAGGTQDFIAELLPRLTDETDTSAPPFFRHGITAGLVLFAGAPNPAALGSVKALLALLFGLGSGQTALDEAVDSIDKVLTGLENQPQFAPDMQPSEVAPVATTPTPVFDDEMNAVTVDSDRANIPFDP